MQFVPALDKDKPALLKNGQVTKATMLQEI